MPAVTDLVVVDASALAGLVLPDEGDGRLAGILAQADAVAPALLWAEMRNLLVMAERRGRIGPDVLDRALAIIDGIGVTLDANPSSPRVIDLARRHGLTVYDALYLELALRVGAPLATADRDLSRAAGREGVALV